MTDEENVQSAPVAQAPPVSAQNPDSPSWVETMIGILLRPSATFAAMVPRNEDKLEGYGDAALTVFFVFLLEGIRTADASHLGSAWISAPLAVFGGFVMWLTLSAIIAIAASCFGAQPARVRASHVALGWSFLPWIFMPPLFCYHNLLGPTFPLFAGLPTLWIFILQMIAIKEVFALKTWQTMALIFAVPMLLGVFETLQFLQSLYVSLVSLS